MLIFFFFFTIETSVSMDLGDAYFSAGIYALDADEWMPMG